MSVSGIHHSPAGFSSTLVLLGTAWHRSAAAGLIILNLKAIPSCLSRNIRARPHACCMHSLLQSVMCFLQIH